MLMLICFRFFFFVFKYVCACDKHILRDLLHDTAAELLFVLSCTVNSECGCKTFSEKASQTDCDSVRNMKWVNLFLSDCCYLITPLHRAPRCAVRSCSHCSESNLCVTHFQDKIWHRWEISTELNWQFLSKKSPAILVLSGSKVQGFYTIMAH